MAASQACISISQNFTEVDGLRIFHDATNDRPGIRVIAITGGNTSVATRCLGHGPGSFARFAVGALGGTGLNQLTLMGCVAVGGNGFVLNAFTDVATLAIRAVNCTALNCIDTFAAAQFGAGFAALDIINTISINPSNSHLNIVVGDVTITGKANIQDDSGAAGTLPDDDPEFPTFFDVPVVFEEDNPSPAQRLILRRKENDDVTTLVSEVCLAFETGAPDSDTEQFEDINGLAIPTSRHIGALVPIAAGPHITLVNL